MTKEQELMESKFVYVGNFSAVDPPYSILQCCYDCKVEWTGCWDNFMCPKCGKEEIPKGLDNEPK